MRSVQRVILISLVFAILAAVLFAQTPQAPASPAPQKIVQSIVLSDRTLDTKTYLDQAWEQKARAGLVYNSGLAWDPAARQWSTKSKLPDDALKAIAHYASFTANAARFGVNVAQTYHELDRFDELAKFYSAFLKVHFTTLGEMREISAPEIKQKLLGTEIGPDSARTLVWYWKQPDGSVTLRDCYLCNADYFYPAARLVRAIATLRPAERTPGMNQFVADYVPLLVKDHILRPNFTERLRAETNPSSASYKKQIMIADEIEDVATAAEVLGAWSDDPKLVAIADADVSQLKELVKVGVERFKLSRTLTKDADGRFAASYFNGDYDWHEDMEYAGYTGESFPTPAQKAKPHGASWDISHFSLIPMFFRSLNDTKQATGVDFPQKSDLEAFCNQFAFHVFDSDIKKPLFRNFFDGSDGWYRVNYSGRANYGIAPSRYCNMSDPSHGCLTISGIYSWGLLVALNSDVARVQMGLIDLARSSDPSIACFQPACFRERYYRYGEASFSFLDQDGNVQYPPALIMVVSEVVLAEGRS